MLEISLAASIPTSHVGQVLDILAGHSASQPVRLQEHHVLFKPRPAPEKPLVVGGSQDVQTRPFREQQQQQQSQREALILRLSRPVGNDKSREVDGFFNDDDGPDGRDILLQSHERESRRLFEEQGRDWTITIYDLPQAAPKNITSRTVWVSKGVSGDIPAYLEKLEYSLLHHYLLVGYFLVIKNVVVRIYQIRKLPPAPSTAVVVSSEYADSIPPPDQVPALDPARTYLIEASIRVTDGTKPELVTRAIKELEEFRKRMAGVIDLVAPDRLSMDTRVRPQ